MKPPDQLRCEPGEDDLVLTLGGIRADHWWQRHPVLASLAGIALAAVLVAIHAYLAGLIALVVLLGYNHFTTGQPEQQRVVIEPDRIRFHHHDLSISALYSIDLDENGGGPVLTLTGPTGEAVLYMQLEPMHHGRWLRDFLQERRRKARVRRGSEREIPRELRQLRE